MTASSTRAGDFESLFRNNELRELLGGSVTVTLGDATAKDTNGGNKVRRCKMRLKQSAALYIMYREPLKPRVPKSVFSALRHHGTPDPDPSRARPGLRRDN